MRHILYLSSACFLLLFPQGCSPDRRAAERQDAPDAVTVSPTLSHLHVRDFCQDSLGYMWIATARGLNRYNGYDYRQFFHDKRDTATLDNDMIHSLLLDSRHRLWVGTSTGVNRYDFTNDRFVRYRMPYLFVHAFYEDPDGEIWVGTSSGVGKVDEAEGSVEILSGTTLSPLTISTLLEDKFGKLWAGTSGGIAQRSQNGTMHLIPLPGNRQANCICLDPQGMLLIGTDSGVVFFDPQVNGFVPLPEQIASDRSLSTAYIHFIKEIEPLKYLVGTSADGLFLYDALRQSLQHNPFEYTELLDSNQPMCCSVDKQGNVWIGSFEKGFAVYNTRYNFFNRDPKLQRTFKDVFTTRIVEDRYNNLWMGTRYRGLYHYAKDGKVRVYDSSNSPLFKDNNNLVEELFADSRGRLWVVGADRIVAGSYDPAGNFTVLRTIPAPYTGSGSIAEDEQGNIWFGLRSGLFVLRGGGTMDPVENVRTGNVTKVYPLRSGELLFSVYSEGVYRMDGERGAVRIDMPSPEAEAISRHCVDLFEDNQGRLWFGSYNEGTMYTQGDECRTFSVRDGLPCNDITCIRADGEGSVWMSTAQGLSRIGPDLSITNYFSYDGTQGNLYHEKSSLLSSDGRMFFTGNHGLTFFDLRLITHNSNRIPVVIEDLKIQNESERPGGRNSVLTRNISFTDKVVLGHKHTVITLDYSGIDFLAPQKLTYAYKLEGLDQQWNHVGNHRRATYSNLTPGSYTFKIKAFNSDGMESLHPAALEIRVNPAPWATWWAWLLYLAVICAALYAFIHLWTKIRLQRHSLEMEAYEREREHEVSEMKMTFFTNISHELRTPLTLISAPVQQLLGRTDPQSPEGMLLQTISRNGNRLHRLMDQLLDFRKMEDGILALKVQSGDLAEELASVIGDYATSASEKGIDVEFTPHRTPQEMWYDPDKVEKIMHNLLSNAMKHVPRNGRIAIATRDCSFFEAQERYGGTHLKDEHYVEVSVTDNGPGIPPDRLGELFVRYRQIESPTGLRPDYAGTGIGLHYTKRLIEVHRGGIMAELPEQGGMRFTFLLPTGDQVYDASEKAFAPNNRHGEGEEGVPVPEIRDIRPPDAGKHQHTVLIAEDNLELMIYFRQMLGERYNILEASDGIQAWELLQKQYVDLVLSDVVMPGLSGVELCENVKQDPLLSHIPVILLTAKTSMPEQIEGLSHGADAYICKPFNVDYLLLTIENRLSNREKLRTFYSTPQPGGGQAEAPVKLSMLDRRFMDKLMEHIENGLSDPELNIDGIAREMAFSRTSFYRKLKGLTDMAPTDFIRNYRLKRAAEMILEGSWSLYEVAERAGFGNYTHFSTLFKKHFGASPKHYKDAQKAE